MATVMGPYGGLRVLKDYDSSFESSKYAQQYQKELSSYQQKRKDYLLSHGYEEVEKKSKMGVKYKTFERKSSNSRDDPLTQARKGSIEKTMEKEIGAAPSALGYYNQYRSWKAQGKPEYQAVDPQPESKTQDTVPTEGSGTNSPASSGSAVAKGYEIFGAHGRTYGYTPAAGDGVGRRQTDEGGGDLGTAGDAGTGQPVRKRYKPLGK